MRRGSSRSRRGRRSDPGDARAGICWICAEGNGPGKICPASARSRFHPRGDAHIHEGHDGSDGRHLRLARSGSRSRSGPAGGRRHAAAAPGRRRDTLQGPGDGRCRYLHRFVSRILAQLLRARSSVPVWGRELRRGGRRRTPHLHRSPGRTCSTSRPLRHRRPSGTTCPRCRPN